MVLLFVVRKPRCDEVQALPGSHVALRWRRGGALGVSACSPHVLCCPPPRGRGHGMRLLLREHPEKLLEDEAYEKCPMGWLGTSPPKKRRERVLASSGRRN